MANFEMSVGEYMLSPVITVKRGATLREADQVLHEHGISALAVTDDDGALVGVLSRTDLLAAGSYGHDRTLALPEEKVEKRMTSPALAVDVEAPLSEAAKTMRKERVHRVFVTRDGALAGVLSTRDLMRAVRDKGIKTPLEEVASSSLVKVKAEDPVALAVDRLDRANKQVLVVVEGAWPVGIFDQAAALAARGLEPEERVEEAMNLSVLVLPGHIPLARAAAQALAMHVRRILILDDRGLRGIVSGLDFARAVG